MKKLLSILIVGLITLTALPGLCQSLPRADSVQAFWQMGERRVYQFYSDSAQYGLLKGLMYGMTVDVAGTVHGWRLQSKLSLNLSLTDIGSKIDQESMLRFDTTGRFLSTELDIQVDDRQDRMQMRYDSTSQTLFLRQGEDLSQSTTQNIEKPIFAYDPYHVDQLSVILAMHDLNIGETFEVPIFSPQGLYRAIYEFKTVAKVAINNTPLADSVWRVEILSPVLQTAFVDKHHRLILLQDQERGLTAELAWIDPPVRQTPPPSPTEVVSGFRDRIPQYGLYLLAALIWLIFLGREGFREKWAYLLFVIGALAYLVVYVTHDPIQRWYGEAVLRDPAASMNLLGLPPALITGFIHETLILLPLFILTRLAKPRTALFMALGAFVGAGFGYFAACQTSLASDSLIKILLVSNLAFVILFHAATGALLGYGLARRKTLRFYVITIVLNAFAHYMVFLTGSGRPSVEIIKNLTLFQALYSVALLVIVFLIDRNFRKQYASAKMGRR